MSELLNKYLEAKKQINELQEITNKLGEKAFKEGVKNLFAKHPKLDSFSWTQYTPYFNDGDPCRFRTNACYANIEFDGEEHEEGYIDKKNTNKEYELAAKEVHEFLGMFDEADYEAMFEDHVKVTATRDGIESEEYSHD